MRTTTNILATLGALSALTAAVPLAHKLEERDVVWVTKTDEVVVTVPLTTTIWVTAGGVAAAQPTTEATTHVHASTHKTSHLTSTVTVHRVSSSTDTPEASKPTTTSTTAPVVKPTSTAETSEASTSTTAPVVEPTTTTPATTAAPAPTTPSTTTTAAAPTSSGTSGAGLPSGSTDGEITYYAPGTGSCGVTSTASDLIVAIPVGVMNNQANPNDNPLCGKTITLTKGGVSVQATVTDTCPSCEDNHVDCSPAVFEKFAPLAVGVVQGIDWWFDS